MAAKPTLAVFKFASCDGCQLSLLDAEDELLAVAGAVDIAYFLEARTQQIAGPYDVGLVEGSITTAHDAARIQEVRKQCRFLVTIGACATAGGIQALRNWVDVGDFISRVYARPDYIQTLATSTPISDHVAVDFELRGCPINKHQLVDLVAALAAWPQAAEFLAMRCASIASVGKSFVSRWLKASPVWGRSHRQAAASSARHTTATATDALAPRRTQTQAA